MVGTGRFELPTPRTPSECSTRLSHVPTKEGSLPDNRRGYRATDSLSPLRYALGGSATGSTYSNFNTCHLPLSLSASCIARGGPEGGTVTSIHNSWPGFNGNREWAFSGTK